MITITNEGWKKGDIDQLCYKGFNPERETSVCGHWCPMLKITDTTIKVCCGHGMVVEYAWTKDERIKP